MNKLQILGFLATISSIALLGTKAEAFGGKPVVSFCPGGAECCYSIPENIDTGDEYYGSGNWDWCRSGYLIDIAAVFGATSHYWGGHGWNDACSTDNPTGRFYTSIVALTQTSPNKAWPNLDDTGGDILRWGAGWTARVHDDLRANCANGETAQATTTWPWYTTLWVPNHFFSTSKGTARMVVHRAATMLHEAVHQNGTGTRHWTANSMDGHWGDQGAWHFHAAWLSLYGKEGVNAPIEQRCAAEDMANDILKTRFLIQPDIFFNDVDDSLCP